MHSRATKEAAAVVVDAAAVEAAAVEDVAVEGAAAVVAVAAADVADAISRCQLLTIMKLKLSSWRAIWMKGLHRPCGKPMER